MKFPTYDEMAKNVAEKALDEYLYEGKTLREWVKEIQNPQPKTGHWTRELIRNEKGGCIGAKMICS